MPTTTIPIATAVDDARVFLEGSTYPPTGTPTANDTETGAYVQRDKSGGTTTWRNHVGLLRFDTSAIPSGRIIYAAALGVDSATSFAASNTDGLQFVAEYYAWTTPASASNYTITASNSAHSGTSLSSLTAVSTPFTFALTAPQSNINRTGYTGFRIHISELAGGAAPSSGSANYFGFGTYGHPTLTAPRLIVNYTLAASGTSSNQYAAAQDGTTPTGYTGQLTNPDNAVGSGETTQATSTGATQSVNYGSFYSFGSAFADIPTTATITAVNLEARQWIGTTTRGTVGMSLQSAPNTLIGTELSGALSITSAPTAGTAGTGNSYTAWTTLPTIAQLQSSNFRVQVRYQRTVAQAATYTLDWLRLSVTYISPEVPGNVTITAKGG